MNCFINILVIRSRFGVSLYAKKYLPTHHHLQVFQENPKKQKEIGKYIKAYPEDTTVIYFKDLDDYDTNYETKKLFEDIKKYCETHAYELVFFCRDVEEVYLGKRVNDKDKVNEVKRFKSKKMIEAVLPQNLSQNEYKINGSNILNVLDKFWTRKN